MTLVLFWSGNPELILRWDVDAEVVRLFGTDERWAQTADSRWGRGSEERWWIDTGEPNWTKDEEERWELIPNV